MQTKISTHTPLAGRDTEQDQQELNSGLFLLTRPLRDVTATKFINFIVDNISTHTPLAGRDTEFKLSEMLSIISTHTPLAGRDQTGTEANLDETNFYSHAPCGT